MSMKKINNLKIILKNMGKEIFFTHIISSRGIFSIKIPVRILMPSRMASDHLNQVPVAMMVVIK